MKSVILKASDYIYPTEILQQTAMGNKEKGIFIYLILSSFLKNYFHNHYFQGCLRVCSRGHQVRGHPCKLGKLPILYHAKKNIYLSIPFISKKRMDRINPPPLSKENNFSPPSRVKCHNSSAKLKYPCYLLSQLHTNNQIEDIAYPITTNLMRSSIERNSKLLLYYIYQL